MNAPLAPAFDPDSGDNEILEALGAVLASKAWIYSWDEKERPPEIEHAMDAGDEEQKFYEGLVSDNFATTIPGILGKLHLHLVCMCERWVDRTATEEGIHGLYRKIDDFDGRDQLLVHAMHELLHLEWEQNLAAYERSRDDFNLALKLKGLVDTETFRRQHSGEKCEGFLADTESLGDALEERFSNTAQIRKLVRTLVPDHPAYLRKVEVILAEHFQEDSVPWLARDANHLIGDITSIADIARRNAAAFAETKVAA